jgi:exodeoxyribonuclease V alpha subunit
MSDQFKPSAHTILLAESLLCTFGLDPQKHTGEFLAAQVAYHALRRGETCVDLSLKDSPLTITTAEKLSDQFVQREHLSTLSQALFRLKLPLTLVGERLYLTKLCEQEARLAELIIKLRDRVDHATWDITPTSITHPDPTRQLDPGQAAAVTRFTQKNFLLLTGGPGTGKTTTAAAMISTAVREGGYALDSIMLCAPTGRAMSRLHKGIYESQFLADLDLSALKPAHTIQKIAHNPELLSGSKLIFVDECSMVDLPTFEKLLNLAQKARIVLIGDPQQLPSIETGSVFSDLCASPKIAGNKAILSKGHRNEAQPKAWADFTLTPDSAWPDKDKFGELKANTVNRIVEACRGDFSEIIRLARSGAAEATMLKLDSVKILCSHREGPTGVRKLNVAIRKDHNLDDPLAAGSIIMVNKNDHRVTGLSNGDVGVIMANGEACFPENRSGNNLNKIRFVRPSQIPSYEDAFATTIHKSQGSEYDVVHISISGKPAVEDQPDASPDGFLNRELLFTAVTRAKKTVYIYGEETVMVEALRRQATRSSGLEQRLNAIG